MAQLTCSGTPNLAASMAQPTASASRSGEPGLASSCNELVEQAAGGSSYRSS